jgi:EpsI family protein
MRDRREVMLGLGCAAALGTAELLRPRRQVSFMPSGKKLTELVPRKFPGFAEGGAGDIVVPRTDGSLVATLYSDLLTRIYHPDGATDQTLMLLIAYGPAQTDMLQLHRPEVSYPALGFEIVGRSLVTIAGGAAGQLPAVALTASQGDRIEDIIYWTRIGSDLPRDFSEQTWARLRQSIAGDVSDGTLLRASAVRTGSAPQFDVIRSFLQSLVTALPRSAGPVIIGR